MSRLGICDLKDNNWGARINGAVEGKLWSLGVMVGKDPEGKTEVGMDVQIGGEQVALNQQDMFLLCGHLITALFFTTDIPAEMVPQQLAGNVQVASTWASMQAKGIVPLMLMNLVGKTIINGEEWKVDFNYKPNISSLGLVGLDGKKNVKWDGSFRPILELRDNSHAPQFAPAGA